MTRRLTLCHTSDWHLGHTLHGHPREEEHAAFLAFLLDVLEREAVDGLLVAGDVFDSANPPASAQAMLYAFLADARRRMPSLDVLITAGNHDSPGRLAAADPVLRAIGVRVVGTARDDMVVPLHDTRGVAAWVAAVPYLRPSDLPRVTEGDPMVEGVRAVYAEVLAAARARREPTQALLAMGHCHMVDATPSELSERKILGGPQHALPADLFGDDVGYVALGHLHLAQAVTERVHYSGSPIPLSLPEESYPHQVRIVRFEDGRPAAQATHRVPRLVDVYRVPRDGPGTLEEVLAQLDALEAPADVPHSRQPLLDVRVRLDVPVPDLRQQIEAALEGKAVRLVKIGVEYAGVAGPLAEVVPPRRQLGDLTVEEVFRQSYARRFEGDPSPALLAAFHEVAEAARHRLEEGGT
ncbi:MAG: exonuclease SbcCD subunit D C-terminal domain-containing protein [Sandaracinaceae bacterium]|nr:exonuclease SbcCD subunit D C-terminal domain-containing protein [Sandaracinaceae bacterium]